MKKLNKTVFAALAVALLFLSCNKEEIATDVSVFTEEIVFSSGETAIMTGRVLAQGVVAVEDHGFQIATDVNFTNPVTISLGEKGIPGRFVGQTSDLNIRVAYFCRAFIVVDGETKTGNVLEFSTLSPKVLDFKPKEGTLNTTVVAEGRNLTADTRILWNGQIVTPEKITSETFVEFKVPAFNGVPVIDVRIVSQGDTLEFNRPFEYIIGLWTNEGALDDPDHNTRHIYFEDGDDFVYGLGLARGHMTSLVQVLDKNSLQRSTITFPGTQVEGAFFNETYFGGGSTIKVPSPTAQLPLSKEFWKYENQGFIRLEDMPVALYRAVCLKAGNKVYVYGGETSARDKNKFIYEYDINTDTWEAVSAYPFSPLNAYPAFHLNGFNYFVADDGQTYRHDYLADVWTTVANYPNIPTKEAVTVLFNGQAYAGLAGTERVMYTYSPSEDTWRTKRGVPELLAFNTIGAWTNNGKIYVMRTESGDFENRQLWSLDPDGF
jgi:hypothetical protein